MITVKHYKTKEPMEFENGKELKQMLQLCNPTWLRYYKDQLEKTYSFLKIEDCGIAIRLIRLDLR